MIGSLLLYVIFGCVFFIHGMNDEKVITILEDGKKRSGDAPHYYLIVFVLVIILWPFLAVSLFLDFFRTRR